MLEQGGTTRTPQSSVSAALAASNAVMRPENTNAPATAAHSIAEMAQRDLDAALQLLADRAQYITGANGAAIALRRQGKKDMLCRASTGSNVPGLGSLLSTEFGLSGESVRTRQPLRCDDAARDARVNHDVCREMGIASVVVMPVVNDDEVLGVFELFSGKVNAFGERDLSALHRLSELVETAVRLARASQEVSAGMKKDTAAAEELSVQGSVRANERAEFEAHSDVPEISVEVVPSTTEAPDLSADVETAAELRNAGESPIEPGSGQILATQETVAPAPPEKKALFWSAALDTSANAHGSEGDRSQVPPMLRNLRKCQACGFPVSSDRMLCVECEEKKWRGQLRVPRPVAASTSSPESRTGTGAATAVVKAVDAPRKDEPEPKSVVLQTLPRPALAAGVTLSEVVATQRVSSESTSAERVSPDGAPILTGGLAQPESWFATNKYILAAVLVVAAVVVAILFLH